MVVKEYDLYSNIYNARIRKIKDATQGQVLLLQRLVFSFEKKETDRYYTVKINDTLMSIADRFYNEESGDNAFRWYHVLAAINGITEPMNLTNYVGVEIAIPELSRIKELANNV